MNSKSYIGYFSEIRDLEKSKQEELLELARYEAFTTLKLNGMSALFFVISLLSCFLFAIGSYWLFGYFLLANSIAIGMGVVISLFMQRTLNGCLLRKGLSVVLAKTIT
jgi:hypothetical protein